MKRLIKKEETWINGGRKQRQYFAGKKTEERADYDPGIY